MPDLTAAPQLRAGAPLTESCTRLRRLYPDYPRVYAVAAVAEEPRRRWWRLADGLPAGRVELMVRRAADEMHSRDAAAMVVATSLVHAVVGRVMSLVALDGRAWDPGIDNLWIHMDSDGAIDWAGLADTTVRVLPGDRFDGEAQAVTLPCEEALCVWVAHRCITSLDAVFEVLAASTGLERRRFWGIVGEAVVGAATYVPILAGTPDRSAMYRAQLVLDAMAAAGMPVRGQRVV